MKYLLLIILFLIVLQCEAQKKDSIICTSLRIGRLLERDRKKAVAFEQLVKDDGVIIDKLEARNTKQEEALGEAHKVVAAQDSTIKAKDIIITAKDVIISNKKNPIKWWWIPLAVLAGWLGGKA